MALLKKNGKQLNKFFDTQRDEKPTLNYKKTLMTKLHLNAPLFSWPNNKQLLLALIKDYLARLEAESLDETLDKYDDEKNKLSGAKLDELLGINTNNSEDAEESSAESGENTSEETSEIKEDLSAILNSGVIPTADRDGNEYLPQEDYANLPSQIFDIDECSEKVLGNIVRILNYRSVSLKKIRLMMRALIPVDQVNQEIENVAIYNLVLAKYLPVLNSQDKIKTITLNRANKVFEAVSVEGYEEIPTSESIEGEIKKNKEDQDFDIVSAIAYCGVGVDRDDNGVYSITKRSNGQGITYYLGKQEKTFSLSKDATNKFIDNFLNKPIETRKFITPGRVFITYIDEAEKSLGINTRSAKELDDIFGEKNNMSAKAYFKEVIKKYSRNAEEWKEFQTLFQGDFYNNKESKDDAVNRIHIRQQAKRLVIGEMFSQILNSEDILNQEQIDISDYRIGDITRDFGLDIDLSEAKVNKSRIERIEDASFRIINVMHNTLQDMKLFAQDIIDNYTVEYLRREKIFLLSQDDQKEFISKKKKYEELIDKLSYDRGKDSDSQLAYYQKQVDELTQKIGNKEYLQSKDDLLKAKNSYRILLLNVKAQKDLAEIALQEAEELAAKNNEKLSSNTKIEIIQKVLMSAPELVVVFDKGHATSWIKLAEGQQSEKHSEPLTEVDKIIETIAAKISDESHQKIMEENRIRESIKRAQKEERINNANTYISAYGSIVGNASGIGGFGNIPAYDIPATPDSISSAPASNSGNGRKVYRSSGNASDIHFGEDVVSTSVTNNTPARNNGGASQATIKQDTNAQPASNASESKGGNGGSGSGENFSGAMQNFAQAMQGLGTLVAGQVMASAPVAPANQPNYNQDYQNFDYISDNVEPCVIPFIVAYDNKGTTLYGNMMETYATFDRYKFLLTTNNNILYTYIEEKKQAVQTPEQIISDLHIRYLKNAMFKSGLATLDSNLSTFDYKSDVRKFLTKYVPQNMLDIVISDYNELTSSINFDLLKDLIEHRFSGDIENYIPEDIKNDIVKCSSMIASVVKAIMTDPQIKKTYEAYSSKMKQNYINSLVAKIESGDVPTVKLDSDEMYSRLIDYISFSIKGQNVIIQNEDSKDNGLLAYPRGIFFIQKDKADQNLHSGKVLSYEQNELITTRNEPTLDEVGKDVINLMGPLYKYNGGYNKLIIKLKPYNLAGGVKFIENLIDALKEKIDIRSKVLVDENDNKPKVSLVKFVSQKKQEQLDDDSATFDYNDEKWFVRKGFVLDKQKIAEYYFLIAMGRKYALDKTKADIKSAYYDGNLLSLNKINEAFKDLPEDIVSMLTSVIRKIMMSNCERFVDYIEYINNQYSVYFNRMLYINKMILESNTFDVKTEGEKIDTIEKLELDFNTKSEDIASPHPEIYASIEDIALYQELFEYYCLSTLFEKYPEDERFITPELTQYFDDLKRQFRNNLLVKIRDKVQVNGYELEMANYFELNTEKAVSVEKVVAESEEEVEEERKDKAKIKNIDVIFRGIFEGFEKAVKDENNESIQEEIAIVRSILQLVGELPNLDTPEKDLEIALPNNHTIVCNIKGFVQQYLFRFIVDREHELGPFAYVVNELLQHEELGPVIQNLEKVADIINSPELGINLIEKFSSISISNNGNIFKIGDNISPVLETINRLKTPTDIQKSLNRDIFYREGVLAVDKCFEQYFNRRKLENMN